MRVLVACEFSGTVRDAFTAAGHHAVSCDLLPSETPGLHYTGDVLDLLTGWEPVQFTADCDPGGDGWCKQRNVDPAGCGCLGPTQDDVDYRTVNGVLLGRPRRQKRWDLMLAFPPCTYLCSSGLHWNTRNPERALLTEQALEFVGTLLDAPIRRIALENPVGRIGTAIRPADQMIQPHEFGHDASKRTCLWLKNLPPLVPTKRVAGRWASTCGHPRWAERLGPTCPVCGASSKRLVWGNQTDSGQNRLGPSEDRWKLRSETYPGIAAAMAAQWGEQQALRRAA